MLPAGRNVRERLRQIICPAVCAARADPHGPAGYRLSQSCCTALPARAGGTRLTERKALAAREGFGSDGIRCPSKSYIAQHFVVSYRRWPPAGGYGECREISGRREDLGARRTGAYDAHRAAEL